MIQSFSALLRKVGTTILKVGSEGKKFAKVLVKMLGLGIFTQGEKEVVLDATNISDVIECLKRRYPLVKEKICDPQTGKLYPGFEILVNERPIVEEEQVLNEDDVVTILPIFAGG